MAPRTKKPPAVPSSTLTPFEGRDVLATGIEIPNASGGLNEAMLVDPQEFHHSETVHVVLECEVVKVRHDPLKETDCLRRVHVLRAGRATIIDGDAVAEALDAQQRRIEEARGVTRLPADGMGAAELSVEHFKGEHADGLRHDCPECAAEKLAEQEGD